MIENAQAGGDINQSITYHFSGSVFSEEFNHTLEMRHRLHEYSNSMEYINYKDGRPLEKCIIHTRQSNRRWYAFAYTLIAATLVFTLWLASINWLTGLYVGFIIGTALAVVIYRLRAGSHWGFVLEYARHARARNDVAPLEDFVNVKRAIRVISVSAFDNSWLSRRFDVEPSALVEEIRDNNSFETYRIFLDRGSKFFSQSVSRLQPGAVGGCRYHQYGSSTFRLMVDFRPRLF